MENNSRSLLENCEQTKEALGKQVEELKVKLLSAENQSARQERIRLQLSKDLEETKTRLAHQKNLKEVFIKKEKETRYELERLKRLSDGETMKTLRIATEVGNEIKKKKKKELQKDFEELKVAHIIIQENLSKELHAEINKNKALQQELDQLKISEQINLRDKTELEAEREKSKSLQKQLETKIQSQAERMSEKLIIIKQLRAEEDALLQQVEEEIQTSKKNASEKDESFSKEFEDLKEINRCQPTRSWSLRSRLRSRSKRASELNSLNSKSRGTRPLSRRWRTPSMSYQMLSCWKGSKTQRKNLRRKKTQPGKTFKLIMSLM